MELSPQQIDRLKVYYRTLTSKQLAVKYYATHDGMRAFLSRHGIECPRRTQSEKTNALILKLWPRGSADEIAEYTGLSTDAVKRRYSRLTRVLRWVQLALWPPDAFKVDAPPMRIVHSQRPKATKPCGQLRLELFNEANAVAA